MASKAKQTADSGNTAVMVPKKGGAVTTVPDYIKQGGNRGAENVTIEDIALPRLEIVQALSPELKSQDPAYIKGAGQGDLFNTISRQLYGPNVILLPVYFSTQYLVWKDRKKGGGFRGAYDSVQDANKRIHELPADEQAAWEPVETKVFVCLLLQNAASETGEEIVVSMARTKLKVARNWNSLARMAGGDLFSRLYNLFSVDAENSNGDEFKNFNVQLIDSHWPSPTVYKQAEDLYINIRNGKRKVQMNMAGAEEGEGEQTGGEF